MAANITPEVLQTMLASLKGVLVLKFGADWCGPCKTIAPVVAQYKPNLQIFEIDVDESLDLFVAFKRRKMVVGLPTMLAFYGDVKREAWYIADDSVVGADLNQVTLFLNRCIAKQLKLMS